MNTNMQSTKSSHRETRLLRVEMKRAKAITLDFFSSYFNIHQQRYV